MTNSAHINYNHTMPSTAHMNLNPNLNFAALCREGRLKEALHILLTAQNPPGDSHTYLQLLHTCIANNVLSQGKQIHSFITHRGFTFATRTFFQNTVVNMYVKCGSLVDARKLFDEMMERDGFSWNVIIAAYRKHGCPHEALTLFHQMQQTGVKPDQFTLSSVLQACAKIRALEQGVDIHHSIIESGFLSDVVVASALIDMYAKCECIHKAREVFEKMPQRNVVSWNAMIVGYVQNGVLEKASRLFKEMPQRDVVSWNAIIAGCAQNGDLNEALRLFKEMPRRDEVSWNTMIGGYAQNGFLDEALGIFKAMPHRNVVSWNAMIAGFADNGLAVKALETFKQMQLAGVQPNQFTFASIVPACAKIRALEQGMDIYQNMMENRLFPDVVVASALIDMFAKCGSMQKALEVFDNMSQRNVVSWNAMIAGYAHNGLVEKALETFKQMHLAGVQPDEFTFASILPACAIIGALEQGVDIHQSIIENGFFSDVVVASALIGMYAKCGSMQKAQEVFDNMRQRNVVSWNGMITGYAHNGLVERSLEFFKQMQLAGVHPDQFSFASILPLCAKIEALEQGMEIHQSIMENGLISDVVVASALIDMYTKCGSMQKAQKMFDNMPQRNVVSWTAMIAGYAHNGSVEKSLEALKQMQLASVRPDQFTFASIIPACAKIGALEQGMSIHQRTIESGFLSNAVVASTLVDMYAKCGNIQKARQLFESIYQPDAVSWSAMIAGYAMHGLHKDSLGLFELMKQSGTYPDHVSFICVLFACSHAGLVDEGCKYFNGMSDLYCIRPTMDHYVCMVDLLGRAGCLGEALNFIIKMPIKPVVIVWMCLLGACRSHKNIGLGVYTATLLFELDSKNAASYVVLSNIYAEVGEWGDVRMVRRLMIDRGINKIPGCSWIEVHKMVHAFCVGEVLHPQMQGIHAKVEKPSWEMNSAG